jgi:hypothetical protein
MTRVLCDRQKCEPQFVQLSNLPFVRPIHKMRHLSDLYIKCVLCPTCHLSNLYIKCVICPTYHLSDLPFVRPTICPTYHLSNLYKMHHLSHMSVNCVICLTRHLSNLSIRSVICQTSPYLNYNCNKNYLLLEEKRNNVVC